MSPPRTLSHAPLILKDEDEEEDEKEGAVVVGVCMGVVEEPL